MKDRQVKKAKVKSEKSWLLFDQHADACPAGAGWKIYDVVKEQARNGYKAFVYGCIVVWCPGPIQNKRFAVYQFFVEITPISAVFAVVSVVTHNKVMPFGHYGRAVIVSYTARFIAVYNAWIDIF